MLRPNLDMKAYESDSEYGSAYEAAEIYSYEDFVSRGKEWVWCLVGNIVEEHSYGEEHDILRGSKHFRPGAKVWLAPPQWGDGYEKIVVIGKPRHYKSYIEVIMKSEYIVNFRVQQVFKPPVLKLMCNSEYSWWGDTDKDRNEIQQLLDSLQSRK